jgi:serine/threonine-protein kinase
MELVEGATLSERIAEGPLSWDEALAVALQMTAALEAAHGRGIVHRDLKPANVKLRPDGTIKVLDFGIATAPESPLATSGRKSPALLTPALTEAGILLGTAAYMSPEQARGKPTDARADIWAFGCVLYEMLTGQPAFAGEDVTTTLARVLEREPRLEELPRGLPAAAKQALELCLTKDPARRVADIRDVRLVLQGRFLAGAAPASTDARDLRGSRRALPLAAACVAGAAVAVLAAATLWPEPVSLPVIRFAEPLGDAAAPTMLVSAARDGSRVGYAAGSPPQIFVRRLDDFSADVVAGAALTPTALPPCFSPDLASIAFSADNGRQIKKVPLTGGAPLTIAQDLDGADFCDWPGDGYIYFGSNRGIERVPESGGEPELVGSPDESGVGNGYEMPRVLPGAERVLVTVLNGGIDNLGVGVLDLKTHDMSIVIESGGFVTYAASGPGVDRGHIVFGRSGALFAAPVDLGTLETGPVSPVLEGLAGAGPLTYAAVSDSGTLAYMSGASAELGATLLRIARDGSLSELPAPPNVFVTIALSPDGTRAILTLLELETFEMQLVIYEFEGDRLTPLPLDGSNLGGLWARGGTELIYLHADSMVGGSSPAELRMLPADNSALPVTLANFEAGQQPSLTTVSLDGGVLAGARQGAATDSTDLWILRLEDGGAGTVETLLATPADESEPAISPDGRYVAYTSNESGRNEIYVVPLAGPGGKAQVSSGGGISPLWNPLGGELFYVSGNTLMAVAVETTGAFRRLTPQPLFELPPYGGGSGVRYAVAPDGSQFLTLGTVSRDDGNLELRVVVNWFEELHRLAPWPGH